MSSEVIRAACAGEARAHEAIYRACQRPIYTLIRRIVPRAAIADELLQETFVEILRNIRAYSGEGAFGGWVRSIAVTKCLMHLAFMRAEGVFGSAELVPLTPKLGQYFGTDKGLLVVRAPTDERLKLEDGDVIADIDGRTPTSPAHALRILGSYQPGEKLKLNVMRAKKRMAIDVAIPEEPSERPARYLERSRFIERDAPPPPGPPTPPTPVEPFNAPIAPPGAAAI